MGLRFGRGLNIAFEAVDRHALDLGREQVSIRWLGKNGARLDLPYGELAALSNRFASAFAALGVRSSWPSCRTW
jgi:acetyl-CoA synthetase